MIWMKRAVLRNRLIFLNALFEIIIFIQFNDDDKNLVTIGSYGCTIKKTTEG